MAVDAASAKSLFLAASDMPDPAKRADYLGRECGGDTELRARVEALLRANDAAPLPPVGAADATLTHGPDVQAETENYVDSTTYVGSILAGKYKLIEEIGEGGMGSVYMAQQTEPVKRAVAVKVIKAGMDSKAVLARFEAERQALAMMDHPNIAKVLDADTTASGRPFFVMELVKGTPITQFCDERKLTPRQRLELFVPVCQAIQHAHQKGVIHRDIKPSNVLVAMYDDRPVPKVIDFGVAKAAGQSLTDKTLMTGFGAVVGTPEYMSPEQANLNNLDIDTRSDVYSLGVLLYELLTGHTPVDRKSLGKAAMLEILRIVREVEAPRPSAKLSTIDTLPNVAANRGMEPATLSKLMKGELDWLMLKALEKDRARRYDSALGLARDVQRYLADEAVEACPPTLGYRLRKAFRKNRAAVSVTAAFAVVLLMATAVSLAFGIVADQSRRAAVSAGKTADEKRRETDAANEQLRLAQEKQLADQYVWDMQILPLAFESGNAAEVNRVLNRQAPLPDQPDRRGFEWYYWNRLVNTHLAEIQLPMESAKALRLTHTQFPVEPAKAQRWAVSEDGSHVALHEIIERSNKRPTFQLRVWDVATKKLVLTHAVEGQPIWSSPFPRVIGPHFSGDGKKIAVEFTNPTSALQTMLEILEVATGKVLVEIKDRSRNNYQIGDPNPDAFSPDGRLFAAPERQARKLNCGVWDLEAGKKLFTVNSEVTATTHAPIRFGKKQLVTFSHNLNRIRVVFWNLDTGTEAIAWEIPTSWTNPAGPDIFALSPDGQKLAGANESGLKIWEAATGKLLHDLPYDSPVRPHDQLSKISFSPDGTRLAILRNLPGGKSVPAQPVHITLADPINGKLLRAIDGSAVPLPNASTNWVLFSPDSQLMAVPADTELRIWSAMTGQQVQIIRGFDKPIVASAFSLHNKQVWAVDAGGLWKEWHAVPPEPVRLPWFCGSGTKGKYYAPWFCVDDGRSRMAFVADDDPNARSPSHIQVATTDGRSVRRLPMPTQAIPEIKIPDVDVTGPIPRVAGLAMSRDARRIAMHRGYWYSTRKAGLVSTMQRVDVNRELLVWDIESGNVLLQKEVNGMLPGSLAISPDGSTVAVVTQANEKTLALRTFEVASQREVLEIPWETDQKSTPECCFSPDGRKLLLTTLRPSTASLSPAGQILAFDLEKREIQHRISFGERPRNWVESDCNHLAWSPDSSRFADTRRFDNVAVYDIATGQTTTLELSANAQPSNGGFGAPAFSPDGKRIAALFDLKGLSKTKVWDTASRKELLTLQNGINMQRTRTNDPAHWGLKRLFFSADNRRLMFAEDRSVGKLLDEVNFRAFLTIVNYP